MVQSIAAASSASVEKNTDSNQSATSAHDGFTHRLIIEKHEFTANSQIFVASILANVSTNTLFSFELSQKVEFDNIGLNVTDSDGVDLPPTLYGAQSKVRMQFMRRGLKRFRVKPGEVRTNMYHVNRFFDMSLDGKYFIKVVRDVQNHDETDAALLESNIIEVTVGEQRTIDELDEMKPLWQHIKEDKNK